jgi:ATP-dependent Clp protease ATP-binding subunit ClpA
MHDFLQPNSTAYAELAVRATGRIVRFRGQSMPPGAQPPRADVGFEVAPRSGQATLWVSEGVAWQGNEPQVKQWLAEGQRVFANFDALASWVQGPLARSYHLAPVLHQSSNAPLGPMPTTDLAQVNALLAQQQKTVARLDAETLYQGLSARVVGQEAALRAMSSTVARHLARIHPSRPAVLMSLGPTGVGKTLSAEVLANLLTERTADSGQQAWRFLRLDMSEYAEPHRVSQLLGAPQGYVGHGQRSELVDALASGQPGVLLFDEIEKAHPSIFKLLMNAMDAGRLSSAQALDNGGHQLDCRRWIFVFTSNLYASEVVHDLQTKGIRGDNVSEADVCRRHLRAAGLAPELIGRIGRFLVYRPFTQEERVGLILSVIREMAAEYGVTVDSVNPEVIAQLLEETMETAYGGRSVRNVVDEIFGEEWTHARRILTATL